MSDTPEQEMIRNIPFSQIEIGHTLTVTRQLKDDDVLHFAHVSGDTNPIHLDPSFAHAQGLTSVTAHSMWNSSQLSGIYASIFPGVGTIFSKHEIDFSQTYRLFVGDTAEFHLKVVDKIQGEDRIGKIIVEVEIRQQSTQVVIGYAKDELIVPDRQIEIPAYELPHFQIIDRRLPYQFLLSQIQGLDPVKTVVVYPVKSSGLQGAIEAMEKGIITPILVGPEKLIKKVAEASNIDLTGVEIRDTPEDEDVASNLSTQIVASGEAQMIMKGNLHSDAFLHPIVKNLRVAGKRLTHCFYLDIPGATPIIVSDAAVNITPDLDTKAQILKNAVELAVTIGMDPYVAILTATETIEPKNLATIDASSLTTMCKRGQIDGVGKDIPVDGPLGTDNALSAVAAKIKGIESDVAGKANVLITPDMNSANILVKAIEVFTHALAAGVVLGAKVPIILTSRADPPDARVASCVLARLIAEKQAKH